MDKLNVCWNNIYRKIFRLHIWEYVKLIQLFCGRLDLIRIFRQRKFKLSTKLMKSVNIVLQSCYKVVIRNNKFRRLCNEYNIVVDDALHSGKSLMISLQRFVG